MMIGACAGSVLFIIALLFGPETKGIVRWVTSILHPRAGRRLVYAAAFDRAFRAVSHAWPPALPCTGAQSRPRLHRCAG
jgi:hypothetical protein